MTEAAERLARGELAPWTTIIARHQTLGRGRRERRWDARSGDALLATVMAQLAIPPERMGMIALATGLAVADALSEWDVSVSLKWPNDVYLDDRKLGGILIQTRLDSTVTALIGIGINLSSVPPDHSSSATCLAVFLTVVPQPRALAVAAVRHLQARADQLEAGKWQAIIDDWTVRAVWIGEPISVTAEVPVAGTFVGVDEFGRMLVSLESGVQVIAEGDVQRGPRRSLYLDMN